MIRKLTLRAKMIAAFSVMAVLMGVLAGVALHRFAAINANVLDLGTHWLPSVETLGDVEADMLKLRLAHLRQALAHDGTERATADKLVAQRSAHLEERRAAYMKLISTPEERDLWGAVERNWSRYLQYQQETLVPLVQAGRQAEARAALFGGSLQRFDDALDLVDRLVDLTVQGGEKAVERSRADASSARAWLIGVAAFSLLAAMALAVVITGYITGVIGGEPAAVGTVVARIAQGDLSTAVTTRDGDRSSILAGIARMQAALLHVVGEVRSGAQSVASASSQIAQGNLDLSSRTEEQASSLQQTAASVEQMASAVKNNADTASKANQLAAGASQAAVEGGEVVQQVVATMADISEASRRIADIIAVIDGIAFQTNILALNAAVEAARAGEHGKGFAVVAAEVRNLAQRSATAAREIKGLIGASVSRVDDGSRLVADAGRTMDDIVSRVRRVSDLMNEISAATVEQSGGISQINLAVAQLDQTTQQNAALVEEASAASESLKTHGARLLESVAVFRLAGHGA
ncbi:methyl-accepting chemotaxis protein [Piscinibacter sp. XHJ-5]|uniref:methyl-accepting chemotaxis protein n=1 Tax=Piscinibacter sp. XHJ-5 TaxID=3037797 RepID=UPI0024532AD4|nr:methyl-accepting chemotaxis protein [Piscinibacter sp. XHJ-5]